MYPTIELRPLNRLALVWDPCDLRFQYYTEDANIISLQRYHYFDENVWRMWYSNRVTSHLVSRSQTMRLRDLLWHVTTQGVRYSVCSLISRASVEPWYNLTTRNLLLRRFWLSSNITCIDKITYLPAIKRTSRCNFSNFRYMSGIN